MRQRKKPTNTPNNKENSIPFKKINPYIMIISEEMRLPTTMAQFKQVAKSTELRRKKEKEKCNSQKARCISVKQPPLTMTMNMKEFMRRFKSLKAINSKSKSPVSSKSKHKHKKLNAFCTNANSSLNLTLKLERTLKKLRENGYFKYDDEELPLQSTSEQLTSLQKETRLSVTSTYEELDIDELRYYCAHSDTHKRNIQFFRGDLYQSMALKIQRAWRKYRTKHLVQRYISKFAQIQRQLQPKQQSSKKSSKVQSYKSQHSQKSQSQSQSQSQRQNQIIDTQNFYPQQSNRKVTYISNLQDQDDAIKLEEVVKQLKVQQLHKWNKIIQLISGHDCNDPAEVERLLAELAKQSQINKKDLQNKAVRLRQSKAYKQFDENEQRYANTYQQQLFIPSSMQKHIKRQSQSSSSMGDKDFNSKKYIDYLDADMYPIRKQISTISKERQQELLSKLTTNAQLFFMNLGVDQLYKSESDQMLNLKAQEIKSSKRMGKSTSEKCFKKIIQTISSLDVHIDGQDDLNIDLIRKEFLQGEDPMQNIQQQNLMSKLAYLNNLKDEDIEQDKEDSEMEQQFNSKENYLNSQISLPMAVEQQLGVFSEYQILKAQQQGLKYNNYHIPLHKVQIESFDECINDSDQFLEQKQQGQCKRQKVQRISTMIFNGLLFELLNEISKRPQTILLKFKNYVLKLKGKTHKVVRVQRKQGFKSNLNEIKDYINMLSSYILSEQPHLLKNLQIPTGPTALQMLSYMHLNHRQISQEENQQQDSSAMVIPNRIFQDYWAIKQNTLNEQFKQQSKLQNQFKRFQFFKGLNKVFLRSLFDSFNQCLDLQRNYGQFGKPFPWKCASSFHRNIGFQQSKKSLQNSKNKLIEISSTHCGLIIQKQQIGQLYDNKTYLQHIQNIQQDKLSKMLATQLLQNQEKWLFYDDQQTEILVELSSLVYFQLILEILQDCSDILQ